MGTDIHSVVQVRRNGKWETILQDFMGDPRNYNLFGALANVRNGRGFAGIYTGEALPIISEPKGLPEDFEMMPEGALLEGGYAEEGDTSDGESYHPIPKGTPSGNDDSWSADEAWIARRLKALADSNHVSLGDHSFSWVTLEEVNRYVETHSQASRMAAGVVSEREYLALKKAGKTSPDSWSGTVSGPGIGTLEAEDYDHLVLTGALGVWLQNNGVVSLCIYMEWPESLLETSQMTQVQTELTKLAKKYEVGPADIRYVFGFDS